MVFLIPKQEMPQMQYTPVKYKNEITMMGVTPKGPIIMYTDTDEVVFITWDEIVAYAATAPRQELQIEPPPEPEPAAPAKKPAVREVNRPAKPN